MNLEEGLVNPWGVAGPSGFGTSLPSPARAIVSGRRGGRRPENPEGTLLWAIARRFGCGQSGRPDTWQRSFTIGVTSSNRGHGRVAEPCGTVTISLEVAVSAAKATNLKLEELPPRVRAALERGETVAISGAEGTVGELVPFVGAKRRLGALAGQARLHGDIEAPTNEPWEALHE